MQQIETKKQIEFDEFKRYNRALGEFGGMKRRLAWRRGIKEAERGDLFCWEGVGRSVGRASAGPPRRRPPLSTGG